MYQHYSSTCRFCGDWKKDHVKYGVRHYACHECYLNNKSLRDLHPWQVSMFSYSLLKNRGLLDLAYELAGPENPINGDRRSD